MAAIRDPHAGPPDSGEPPPAPEFSQTAINTHVSQTSFSLDKEPIHVEQAVRTDSPTAEFFGSIRNLMHRELSFDILSLLMIIAVLGLAFWVGSRMITVLSTYGQRIMENRSTR